MKTAIKWVTVLASAFITHLELAHRRLCAVVRNVFDNRESRSAVDAIDERITVTAVMWVEQFV